MELKDFVAGSVLSSKDPGAAEQYLVTRDGDMLGFVDEVHYNCKYEEDNCLIKTARIDDCVVRDSQGRPCQIVDKKPFSLYKWEDHEKMEIANLVWSNEENPQLTYKFPSYENLP